MTGKAFLKRLTLQLDFLNESDQETVLDFYRAKIQSADTLVQEEKIVASFGAPEKIAQKLKEAYFTEDPPEEDAKEDVSLEASEDPASSKEEISSHSADRSLQESAPASSEDEISAQKSDKNEIPTKDPIPESEEELALEASSESNQVAEEEEVIFSKALNPEKAPEVIQSLENKEIKTLYGEKVVIEEREEPIETFELDPIDEENHLTAEEIQEAKAVTLEKAEQYSADTFSEKSDSEEEIKSTPEEIEEEKKKASIAIEEEEIYSPQKEKKPITGLFTKMFASSDLPSGVVLFFKALLSILFSPLLLVASAILIALYVLGSAALIAVSLAMVLFILALIVFAVIEIIHGLALLFDQVLAALIEIGLATVLFGIVCAIAAGIYQFIFGVFPKAIKKFTFLFANCMKNLFCYLYGGNA